jgi:hypothetical protein
MSMLVKLYPEDVNCLQEYLAPGSSLLEKLKSSCLDANALPIELSAHAIICTEIEGRELLRVALQHCSQKAIQEIQSAMKLCGLL